MKITNEQKKNLAIHNLQQLGFILDIADDGECKLMADIPESLEDTYKKYFKEIGLNSNIDKSTWSLAQDNDGQTGLLNIEKMTGTSCVAYIHGEKDLRIASSLGIAHDQLEHIFPELKKQKTAAPTAAGAGLTNQFTS